MSDFQMITYFSSCFRSGIPEKLYQGVQESKPEIMHDYPTLYRPSLTILEILLLLKLHTVNSGQSNKPVPHQLMWLISGNLLLLEWTSAEA